MRIPFIKQGRGRLDCAGVFRARNKKANQQDGNCFIMSVNVTFIVKIER